MLHKFFEPGDWFGPKTFGYGSGLPIAWQGWVLLASYIALVIGLAAWAQSGDWMEQAAAWVLIAAATVGLVLIARKRTRGGWRWRKGGRD